MVQRPLLKTTTGEIAADLFEARAEMDVSASSGEVHANLILHAREDAVVPIEEGRFLATGIQGRVRRLDRAITFCSSMAAWQRFGEGSHRVCSRRDSVSRRSRHSPRERRVLRSWRMG
jgi:hypothetical protein